MDHQTLPGPASHDATPAPGGGPFARVTSFVGRLGGKLGIGVAVLGFLVIFLGWNGAASFNDLRQQFPYLISGGLAGLGFVTIGAALLIVENSRKERAELIAAVTELTRAVEGMSTPPGAHSAGSTWPLVVSVLSGQVVAGASSFHRPDCRLLEGRTGITAMEVEEAEAQGLAPCRVCEPSGQRALLATGSVSEEVDDDDLIPRRRQLRAR